VPFDHLTPPVEAWASMLSLLSNLVLCFKPPTSHALVLMGPSSGPDHSSREGTSVVEWFICPQSVGIPRPSDHSLPLVPQASLCPHCFCILAISEDQDAKLVPCPSCTGYAHSRLLPLLGGPLCPPPCLSLAQRGVAGPWQPSQVALMGPMATPVGVICRGERVCSV
jgi:hypothetical protein